MKIMLSEMQIQMKMYILKIANYLTNVNRVYCSTASHKMVDSWDGI